LLSLHLLKPWWVKLGPVKSKHWYEILYFSFFLNTIDWQVKVKSFAQSL